MRVSRTQFSKRRSRRKTSFPIIAIVKKKIKPEYNLSTSFGTLNSRLNKITRARQSESRNQSFRPVPTKKSRATIDYKNVVLLRKLITAEGKILPRRINKLTAKQQRAISKEIKSARIMGLLPFINKSRPLT